jgi:hypothetical protein
MPLDASALDVSVDVSVRVLLIMQRELIIHHSSLPQSSWHCSYNIYELSSVVCLPALPVSQSEATSKLDQTFLFFLHLALYENTKG